LTGENAASCALIGVRFAPTREKFAGTVVRFARTRGSDARTCASIARIGVKALRRLSYVPIAARSDRTRVRFAAIDATFVEMSAIDVVTCAITGTIGAMPGETRAFFSLSLWERAGGPTAEAR
jgi:hypothetical protein